MKERIKEGKREEGGNRGREERSVLDSSLFIHSFIDSVSQSVLLSTHALCLQSVLGGPCAGS